MIKHLLAIISLDTFEISDVLPFGTSSGGYERKVILCLRKKNLHIE